MHHSDTNDDNIHEGPTTPYRPMPQPPVPQGDLNRGWTDPNQYVPPGRGRVSGENYGPVPFSPQVGVAQHPTQPMQSGQPNYPNSGDSRLGSGQMQARQLPAWGTPPGSMTSSRPRGCRSGAILTLTLVLLLVFGVGLFSGWVFARDGIGGAFGLGPSNGLQTNSNTKTTVPTLDGNNLDTVREAVISKVEPAVVQINVLTNQGTDLGSGVVIDKRGYIVTNNHVVAGGQDIQVVLADNSKYIARVAGTDPADDLAVVKINAPTDLVTATLGDSSQLHIGQEVLAMGNPLGITQTVTRGIISALGRNVPEQDTGVTILNAIQTDAPINPGNSGGALVDLQGNVIGIPTLGAIDPEFHQTANGVGFAITSNRVNFIAQQLIQSGRVTRTGAAMGITGTTVNANVSSMARLAVDHGVLITSLSNGGPAQRAGLQVGDVIVQIDNKQIDSLSALQDALLTKNPGDKISVKVYRGNQQLTVNLTLTELQPR